MFGKRGKRGRHHVSKDSGRPGVPNYDDVDEPVQEASATAGPFDEEDAPQDPCPTGRSCRSRWTRPVPSGPCTW
jgi:hypothetical protein